eukprot:3551064-Pyramimonas_sp.AAC.1
MGSQIRLRSRESMGSPSGNLPADSRSGIYGFSFLGFRNCSKLASISMRRAGLFGVPNMGR